MKEWHEVPTHHPDELDLLWADERTGYYIYEFERIGMFQLYQSGETPLYFDSVEEIKDYFVDELDLPILINWNPNPIHESFKQGWDDLISGRVYDISTLWDDF